jgi:hypothetical protein
MQQLGDLPAHTPIESHSNLNLGPADQPSSFRYEQTNISTSSSIFMAPTTDAWMQRNNAITTWNHNEQIC